MVTPQAWVKARCLHNPAMNQIRAEIQADWRTKTLHRFW